MSRVLAIWFGVGLLRPAPGTWGSAVAVILGLGIDRYLGFPALVLATAVVAALGFWACARELAGRPDDDPSEFVIDEVAGQWLALLFPAAAFWSRGMGDWALDAWPGWVAAFLFFGPSGVMLDDLWAGLFAGIAVIVTGGLWHAVFVF